jgi:membrane protease YdiL (CAAX protease family)
MSDSGVISIEPSTGQAQSHQPDDRRLRWFEVFLVLMVAFGGPLLNSLGLLATGASATSEVSNTRWFVGIVQETAALLLLGYVLSRHGRRFKDVGFRWSLRDVGAGLLLAVASYAVYVAGYMLVRSVHHVFYSTAQSYPTARDFFGRPSVAFLFYSLLNPFCEELIVRAYLMTEVIELTGSPALAVAVSLIVQSSYHLYYGWVGAITLAFLFLTFAVYFAHSRKILPVIIAHGFFDIFFLLRLWGL